MSDQRIPITLLTGFLGSGKTTLLKSFLSATESGKTAIIVNEYGETQIDGDLITFAGDTTAVRTTTGCLCCTISGDVRQALMDLSAARTAKTASPFEHLIIETTGLADPVSLVHAILTDETLSTNYRFDRVLTLIEALRGETFYERYREARQQIALADHIVLTKTDQIEDPISQRELDKFAARLARENPAASVSLSSELSPTALFAPSGEASGRTYLPEQAHNHGHDHHHNHSHTSHGVNSFTLTFQTPFDPTALKTDLTRLGEQHGLDLVRVKGLVPIADGKTLLVQGVGGRFEFSQTPSKTPQAKLVFITNALGPEDARAHLNNAQINAPNPA